MNHELPTTKDGLRALPGFSLLRRLYHMVYAPDQWARVVMNRETQAFVKSLDPANLKVLEISGHEWGLRESFKDYKAIHYPEFDICSAALDETFDLIIAEQVFEHLLLPYRAARNVCKMLRPGGRFLITTPFLLRVHNCPADCSRWTETGLKYFLAECGFELDKIQTRSWGNRACVRANFRGWPRYRPFFHSLRNEPDYPVVIWGVAER